MANPEHLAKIREDIDVGAWNQWRENNVEVKPDLCGANLSEAYLRHANLSDANLIGIDLNLAYLTGADFSLANLIGANLIGAYLRGAIFIGANLRNANLIGADFRNANLTGADLRGTNLTGANLTESILTGADLTGAISEDWQILKSTRLDGVKCDYIFCKQDLETGPTARLPTDPSRTFEPDELVQRFQILASVLGTIELTFTQGMDWKAFLTSFQELHQQRPSDEISIQGIECKDNTFIVRLEVPPEVDKWAIEAQVKQLYETHLKALEAQYERQLHWQGIPPKDTRKIIEAERRENATLMRIFETMANNQSGSKYNML
ncbi:MAG: pentapeptide repeat-containing protein [Cyanobacteria bacterium J06639_14]